MQTWEPSNAFEQELLAAHRAEDTARCFELLRTTEFALPITPAAAAGEEPARWATQARPDGNWLLAYTSVESMGAGTDGQATHCRITSLVELAAGWPDLSWVLAINPGLPVQLLLPSGSVARLAAPTLSEEEGGTPGWIPPLVQKILPHRQLSSMFARRDHRVSGYVHLQADVRHMGSPNVLVDVARAHLRRP